MKLSHLVPIVLITSFACGGGESSPTFTAEQMCTGGGTPLAMYDFDHLQQHYCDVCGAYDSNACVLDWPFNDVPDCKEYDVIADRLRAMYGVAEYSDVATRNLAVLEERKATQNGCMNYDQ